MKKENRTNKIIETLQNKSQIKQQVFDNTMKAFGLLNEVLVDFTQSCNTALSESDKRIHLKYTQKGEFDTQLKVAGDILVYTMHSNAFQFDRKHEIWKTAYVKKNVLAGYSGMISVYNFLADSFKYNRMDDLGYLIARIFINKDNYFFVQGKRQSGFNYTTLGSKKIDKHNMEEIISASIQYCLDFDLLVPPYDSVKMATVSQIHQSISDAKLRTGKRLGFQFLSDDIDV
ncbi:MAG: hypothetical protein J7L96_04010 [Bacteroidales bacterium]|nr:hypothetical protein [Bacteroidales bacterium]